MIQRYFLHLAYNGTGYSGWQIQPNAISIQEEIENALSKLNRNKKTHLIGCGRTDAGVHASCFYAHFDFNKNKFPNNIIEKLNKMLPKQIIVFDCFEVNNKIHARFDAKYRSYKYIISNKKNPFKINQFYQCNLHLDINQMNEACKVLMNTTDFTSFSKLHTDTFTNNCKIFYAQWIKTNDGYQFDIKANRFLRNMVRSIVGTTIEIGLNKISIQQFKSIISSKNRNNAGVSVPAIGLFLKEIGYDFFCVLD